MNECPRGGSQTRGEQAIGDVLFRNDCSSHRVCVRHCSHDAHTLTAMQEPAPLQAPIRSSYEQEEAILTFAPHTNNELSNSASRAKLSFPRSTRSASAFGRSASASPTSQTAKVRVRSAVYSWRCSPVRCALWRVSLRCLRDARRRNFNL